VIFMGKPKFSRKKYETPSHPWQEDRIKSENELIKKYGLKNKREIWKAQTTLRKYRGQARELLARIDSGNPQVKKESDQLLLHLTRMNILPLNSTLDDILALETEPILSRRLQTLAYLKGLANTPMQARQIISHGHIAISGRRITVPGYMVSKDEENEIGYFFDSPLNDVMHPARPSSDFKSIPIKKEVKPEEKIEKEVKKTIDDQNKIKKEEPSKDIAESEKKDKEPTKIEKTKDESYEKNVEEKTELAKESTKNDKTDITLQKDKIEQSKKRVEKPVESIEESGKQESKKEKTKESVNNKGGK
jgi:small subunit ribosomal protein S4